MKNKRQFWMPMSQPVVAILSDLQPRSGDTDWVFPGDSAAGHLTNVNKHWERTRQRAGVPDLTIHDLRATVATWRSNAGDHDRMINAMLAQRPPRGVASRYIDTNPERVRVAFEAHGVDVLAAVGAEEGGDLLISTLKRRRDHVPSKFD